MKDWIKLVLKAKDFCTPIVYASQNLVVLLIFDIVILLMWANNCFVHLKSSFIVQHFTMIDCTCMLKTSRDTDRWLRCG
jgi:hypothetical protein